MALELAERRKMSKLQGELVLLAEGLVEGSGGIWDDRKKGLSESQLRNVSSVALSADCIEVVQNFIRYQMGRSESKGRKRWNLPIQTAPANTAIPAGTEFGKAVIAITDQLKEQKAKAISSDNTDEVLMELYRSFWGYLLRYTKYRKASSEQKGGS